LNAITPDVGDASRAIVNAYAARISAHNALDAGAFAYAHPDEYALRLLHLVGIGPDIPAFMPAGSGWPIATGSTNLERNIVAARTFGLALLAAQFLAHVDRRARSSEVAADLERLAPAALHDMAHSPFSFDAERPVFKAAWRLTGHALGRLAAYVAEALPTMVAADFGLPPLPASSSKESSAAPVTEAAGT
jgi:hypothetical protein